MVIGLKGVCPFCQQSNLALTRCPTPVQDEDRAIGDTEDNYILMQHNHQGGGICEGSGKEPQVVYTPRK